MGGKSLWWWRGEVCQSSESVQWCAVPASITTSTRPDWRGLSCELRHTHIHTHQRDKKGVADVCLVGSASKWWWAAAPWQLGRGGHVSWLAKEGRGVKHWREDPEYNAHSFSTFIFKHWILLVLYTPDIILPHFLDARGKSWWSWVSLKFLDSYLFEILTRV